MHELSAIIQCKYIKVGDLSSKVENGKKNSRNIIIYKRGQQYY